MHSKIPWGPPKQRHKMSRWKDSSGIRHQCNMLIIRTSIWNSVSIKDVNVIATTLILLSSNKSYVSYVFIQTEKKIEKLIFLASLLIFTGVMFFYVLYYRERDLTGILFDNFYHVLIHVIQEMSLINEFIMKKNKKQTKERIYYHVYPKWKKINLVLHSIDNWHPSII